MASFWALAHKQINVRRMMGRPMAGVFSDLFRYCVRMETLL
jgi:hypothetical protein